MTTERVSFPGHLGNSLSGTLHTAEPARGGVIISHCFTCSSDLSAYVVMAGVLADAGYHVLRFDFTGLGRSGGAFRDSTFVTNVGDLITASTWMLDTGKGPSALIGHSMGGVATLIAARRIRTVKSVAVIGSPCDAEHVLNHIQPEAQQTARTEGCAEVDLAGRNFPISSEFLDALDTYDEADAIARLNLPLAVFHAPEDRTVPVSEGERIFDLAEQPKMFVPLMGADHLLTDRRIVTDMTAEIVRWFDATGAGAFG